MARPDTAAVRLLAGEREPVLVASTANLTLSGLQTIDGVSVTAGARVLAKNQTDAKQNGIYEASSGTWYRAGDARTSRAISKGVSVQVQSGTLNGGRAYMFNTLNPDIGDDNITVIEAIGQARAQEILAEILGAVPNVFTPTRTTLKALDTDGVTAAYLTLLGSEGQFLWRTGDYSAEVTADVGEVNYIASDDVASTLGAWVRVQDALVLAIMEIVEALDDDIGIDDTHGEIKIGYDLRPDPLYDDDPTLNGRTNVFIGGSMASTADDRTTFTIGIGYSVLEDATDVYGATLLGFRNGSLLQNSQYATGIGIDCFSYTESLNASTAIGAHCGTYKGQVDLSFIGGSFACFTDGIVTNSVVIGYRAGAGVVEVPASVYSFDNCTLVGYLAGQFNQADQNTFIGHNTGAATDVTGAANTGVGSGALGSVSSGAQNVFVGVNSGSSVSTGSNNTGVGYGAGPASNYANTTSLGNGASAGADNHFVLGNSSIASLRCQQTTITALSDRRDKKDIVDLDLGLDFINAVRPRQFTWNMREDSAMNGAQEAGIIAQELDATAKKFGAEWVGLVDHLDPKRLQATPGKLLFPLIKAVQELSAMVDEQAKTIKALQAQVSGAKPPATRAKK